MNLARWLSAMMAVSFIGAGCSRSIQQLDEADQKNPFYQSGKRKLEARDFPGASADFEQALELQPTDALAHFELGLLQDGENLKPNDYPSAIYHYQKFITLRPQSQKVELVRGFIGRDILALAAMVPHSNITPPQEIARLQSENAQLRQDNDQLRYQLDQLRRSPGAHTVPSTAATSSLESSAPAQPPSSSPPSAAININPTAPTPIASSVPSSPAAPPAASRRRTYVVQKGDTLSSIARKCLGSSTAAEKIYAANRTNLLDKNKLVVGQVLTIPVQ